MTIHAAIMNLITQLQDLDRELGILEWAVVQAKPSTELGDGLAGNLNDAVLEVRGSLHQAYVLSCFALEQTEAQGSYIQRCQALAACQEQSNRVARIFYTRLEHPEVRESLRWLSGQAESEWAAWAAGVSDGLRACADAMITGDPGNLFQALVICWQELSDHSKFISITVNTRTDHPVAMAAHQPSEF
jgi:hypothetical protein